MKGFPLDLVGTEFLISTIISCYMLFMLFFPTAAAGWPPYLSVSARLGVQLELREVNENNLNNFGQLLSRANLPAL